jgi:asparagine synthase (glutamine-hydrolysing)
VLDLSLFLEEIEAAPSDIDIADVVGVIEDYKPLDVQCAAMGLALYRGIRQRYPDWRYLVDGDGGDENLKDYPIEENAELTIRSVVDNLMLYQEGWGVDAIKHSLAYSGGLSRGYVRTYAPAAALGFDAFSPYTTRSVIEAAVAIPFEQILAGDVSRLSTLKQDLVSAGVKATLGVEMPVHEKRRFQDGVTATPRERVSKAWCRRTFNALWQDRQREAESVDRRSGNETVTV